MQTGGVREQPPMQKLPQSANADSFLACRLGRRLDCVPLAHGALREGASLRDGGVRGRLSSPKQPFCGRVPPSPSLPLMPRQAEPGRRASAGNPQDSIIYERTSPWRRTVRADGAFPRESPGPSRRRAAAGRNTPRCTVPLPPTPSGRGTRR